MTYTEMRLKMDFSIVYVFFIRYLFALLVFYNPFVGIFSGNLLDFMDQQIFMALGIRLSTNTYQMYDKLADDMMLTIAFISLAINGIIPRPYLYFAIFLYLWRMLGSVLMLFTKRRQILLFFPNFFLYYFAFFAFLNFVHDYTILNNVLLTNLIIGLLFVINIIQEIILHRYKLHLFRFIYKGVESRAVESYY